MQRAVFPASSVQRPVGAARLTLIRPGLQVLGAGSVFSRLFPPAKHNYCFQSESLPARQQENQEKTTLPPFLPHRLRPLSLTWTSFPLVKVSPSQHTFFASNRQQAAGSRIEQASKASVSIVLASVHSQVLAPPPPTHRPPVQTSSTTPTNEGTYLVSSTTDPWVWRCVRVVCRPSRPTATLRCPPNPPPSNHPPPSLQANNPLPPSIVPPPQRTARNCQELPGLLAKPRRSRTAWSTRSPSDRVALVHPWDPGLASCPHFSQFLHTISTQLYTWTPGSSKRPFLTPSCIFSQLWEHASIIKLFCCSVHFHLPPSSLPLLRSDLRLSTPPRRLLDPPKGTSNETRAPFLPVSSSLYRPPRRPAVW